MSDPGSLLYLSIMIELVGNSTVGRWVQKGQNPNDSLVSCMLELRNWDDCIFVAALIIIEQQTIPICGVLSR